MTQPERRTYPIEFRVSEDGETRSVSWYPALFESVSEDLGGFREKIGRRAFTKTLQEADIRALFNHDSNFVLGRNTANTLALRVDVRGLHASVDMPNTSWANDLTESIRRGDITAGSFGFRVVDDRWGVDERGYPLRELREVQLFDVSVVTYPAYPETEGTASVRALLGDLSQFETLRPVLLRRKAGIPPTEDEQGQIRDIIGQLTAALPEPEQSEEDAPTPEPWRRNLAQRRLLLATHY